MLKLKSRSPESVFWMLLLSWLAVNFLQAWFTGMSNDESYYALWGKNLAWGYFDHPPMVAVFNYLSSLCFGGTLGVRFVTVLAQGVTLAVLWKTLDVRRTDADKVLDFFLVSASLFMFSALGFITTPDAPLLLFAAFFLLAYKNFLRKADLADTLLLSLSMAGMVYSKYQSVLVIGFVVLSNLKLLLNRRFWLSGLLALLLLAPHFWWQFANDFPSFKYHLVDRSGGFSLKFFLEYLPNQLVIFNPLTLGAGLYVMLRKRVASDFERGLRFIVLGFLLFFWATAFRGHVEPHWTVVASLPLIILVGSQTMHDPRLRKFVRTWLAGSLVLLLAVRVALLVPSLASRFDYGNAAPFQAVGTVAHGEPVLFSSSFQKPSLYAFYTDQPATTVGTIRNRRTQFDLWQWEERYEGKPVFICTQAKGFSRTFHVGDRTVEGFHVHAFHGAFRLKVSATLPAEAASRPGDTLRIPVRVTNPYPHAVNFRDPELPVKISAWLFTKKVKSACETVRMPGFGLLPAGATVKGTCIFVVPELSPGSYNLTVTIDGPLGPMLGNELHSWTLLKP